MYVVVVGSRRFENKQQVIDLVNALPPGTILVSGGCVGPDTWAEDATKRAPKFNLRIVK